MFTKNSKPEGEVRGRGRPRGETAQGATARQQLYQIAIRLFASGGYEATTLRDIAKQAGVSVGLLYRYFPSKQAVVLALYDELSAEYAAQALVIPQGTWPERFLFALKKSLTVLSPHRDALIALVPVLVGSHQEGLFAAATEFSRQRVQGVFAEAVLGATQSPPPGEAAALARLLYVVHLMVILWWLLDKSPQQRATAELLALIERMSPLVTFAIQLPLAHEFISAANALVQQALFTGDIPLTPSQS